MATWSAVNRSFLEQCLAEGMSLEAIGRAADRHPSTVSYWLKKHDLGANGRARHSPRDGISRAQLEPLVASGATLREIAATLGRSQSSVRYWIEQHRLERPIQVRNRRRDEALSDGHRTIVQACPEHGETPHIIESGGRVRCKRCRQERVAEWRRRAKLRLIAEAGGRCRLCGYDRCPAALEFHHLDPTTKSFGLSARGLGRSMERLREEASKCILLCSNCHAEVEVGARSID
jgi:transposase